MKKITLVIIALGSFAFLLFFLAPWMTKEFAIDKVVWKLGGPDVRFDYLGQVMAVGDVPKEVSWFPFGRYVTFPGEAGWIVTFYGEVVY